MDGERRGSGGGGGVAVVALVGDDEHGRVHGVALHVLARRAAAHRAALVVPTAAGENEHTVYNN
jgi:hypothetical protein